MPSPKAVLRDITDMGLDPTKPLKTIAASGRIRPNKKMDTVEQAEPAELLRTCLGSIKNWAEESGADPISTEMLVHPHEAMLSTVECSIDAFDNNAQAALNVTESVLENTQEPYEPAKAESTINVAQQKSIKKRKPNKK